MLFQNPGISYPGFYLYNHESVHKHPDSLLPHKIWMP
jgi:hypothetical protein